MAAKQKFKRTAKTELCKCMLTKEEKLDYGQAMADAQAERTALEGQLTSVKKEYQGKIDAATATAERLGGIIRSGYEFRTTDCEQVMNWSDKTVKVIRLDTGEVVSSRRMTEEEKQMPLDVEEGEPETAGASRK